MKVLVCISLCLALVVTGCQKDIENDNSSSVVPSYKLKISFRHKVANEALQIGKTFLNPFNESYTPTAFKYYISNISLQYNDDAAIKPAGLYHLVNEAEENSKSFIIDLPKSRFNKFTFLIGVDEERNTSGTQSGDLDPAKGMFWTWNSGYIMAKLEANSPASTAPANKVELHAGGFKGVESVLRFVTFTLDAANNINIKQNGTSELVLEADVNAWFKGVHDLKISDYPVSTSPGTLSTRFADNYARMFNLVAVNN